MAQVLGMNCKAYYLSPTNTRAVWSGSGQAGLNEISNIRDVTLNLERATADVTTRGNNGWRASAATLKDGTVEFEMVWDTTDAAFAAIQAAYFADSNLSFVFLDGARSTVGCQGLWAEFSIANFSREEPLEGAVLAKVQLKPAYSGTVGAAWVTTS